jgi:hypothetical protein
MNSDAFLRGFMSRFEKIGIELSPTMGALHTKTPGREIFAPKRSDFSGSDRGVAKQVTDLNRRGVKKVPTDPKSLAIVDSISQMYPCRR